MYYRFDVGSWNNKKCAAGITIPAVLGTDQYAAEQISKEVL
jgi:hypothetical protein